MKIGENAAKGREWTQAIKRALSRRGEGDYRKGLDVLADKLVKAAESDESAFLKAIEAVGDRMEGKVKQQMEVTGEDGGPLKIQQIERVIVDPKAND